MVVKVVLQAIRQGELQKCQNWPLQSKAKPEDAFLLAEVMETIKMAIAIQESWKACELFFGAVDELLQRHKPRRISFFKTPAPQLTICQTMKHRTVDKKYSKIRHPFTLAKLLEDEYGDFYQSFVLLKFARYLKFPAKISLCYVSKSAGNSDCVLHFLHF